MSEENAIYKMMLKNRNDEEPIWKKKCLSIEEAAAYFGIGAPKIRQLIKRRDCSFVMYMSEKPFVLRERMEKYLNKKYEI